MVGRFFKEGDAQQLLEAEQHVPDGRRGNCLIGCGSIHAEILHRALETGADLVVMASHKPSFRDYLLGPNAAHVVWHAPKSVLVVRDWPVLGLQTAD